jgi:hypothetical protein
MSQTLMFMPLNPVNGRRTPYSLEEFHEQLARFGIELPDIDEGSNHYSLQLPKQEGFGDIEAEVMFLVEDDVVLGVSIDEAQNGSEILWLQFIQMGYIMKCANADTWYVSKEWASQNQKACANVPGVSAFEIVASVDDFARRGR